MIDGSGDILVGDPPPGEPGWRIAVAPGEKDDTAQRPTLVLKNAAVTTSGDAQQFIEIDGRRYSHIVDPRTGLGLTTRRSATVVARDGITADSLATAASVLSIERAEKLLESTPGTAALFVWHEGEGLQSRATRGWQGHLAR
jgi:thiamine biosynthesis lipoprotein